MLIPIKIDKYVWMNFLHSLLGGIFGGFVVAFALGQSFPKYGFKFYFIFVIVIIVVAILGLLTMGWVNYWWEKSKKRIHKKKANHKL
jgi:hypothetical protein